MKLRKLFAAASLSLLLPIISSAQEVDLDPQPTITVRQWTKIQFDKDAIFVVFPATLVREDDTSRTIFLRVPYMDYVQNRLADEDFHTWFLRIMRVNAKAVVSKYRSG